MMAAGLVDEVRALLERGLSPRLRPLQSIGYRQAVAVVAASWRSREAEQSIVADTMRFAKRQMTWFRHQQPDVALVRGGGAADDAVLRWLEEVPAWRGAPGAEAWRFLDDPARISKI